MDLGTLNTRQKDAVTSTEGRIRVVAGAGSGKTKAAQEMKSRISQLVPPGYTNDFVCTIHGFCVRFLREEIHRLGYPKNFQILDEEDCKTLEEANDYILSVCERENDRIRDKIDEELREMHVVSDGMSCFEAHTSV